MKVVTYLDLGQNELRNAVDQNLASAPSSPKSGQHYYNSASNILYVYNGTTWRPADAAALTDGSVALSALAVNPLARANHTGTQLANTISNLASTVQAYSLDQFAAAAANVSFGSYRLTNIAQATASTDAAQWGQVQSYVAASVAGQTAIKNPARALAASNITLSGTQTIDGVSLAVGDRVLATNQSTSTQNGLYVVASGAWSLATDASTGSQWIEGTEILIAEGSVYGGSIFRQTTTGTITLGTTALAFVQTAKINTYAADGATLTLTGSTFSAQLGYGLTTSSGIAINRSLIPSKYATTITGNGSSTAFTVTHNLATTDIVVMLMDSSGNEVLADIAAATTSTLTVTFGTAPANAVTYRVVVIG